MVLGAVAALAAALFWAIAAGWFSKMGRFMRPAEINFFKGVLAVVLFLAAAGFLLSCLKERREGR